MISSDDEGFSILLGGEARVGHVRDATVFTYSTIQLENANVLPKKQVKWMATHKKTANDVKFFKNRKTLQHYGERVLNDK